MSNAANAQASSRKASVPQLILDLKGDAYSAPAIQRITAQLVRMGLLESVAVWVFDKPHFMRIQEASQERLPVIWGMLDTPYTDAISHVPFPAPFPSMEVVRS